MADGSNTFPLVLAIREDTSVSSAMASFEDGIRQSAARAGVHLDSFGRKYRGLREELAQKVADPLGIGAQLKNLSNSSFQRAIDQQLSASNALAAQQGRLAQANGLATTSANSQRYAYIGLGQQLQDSVIQAQMGTSAFTILAQQGSQAAIGFVNFGGKVGAAARLLAGWQGAVILSGIALAGNLIPALFKTSAAQDDAAKATKTHEDAVLSLAKAQGDAILTAERKQALDTAEIQRSLDKAVAVREHTKALLEGARATATAAGRGTGGVAGTSTYISGTANQQVAELTRQLAENETKLGRLQSGFDTGFGRMIAQRVDAAQTPQGYLDQVYKKLVSKYQQDPELRGPENGAKLTRVLDALAKARDRELKAVNDAEAAQKKLTAKMGEADRLTSSQVASFLRKQLPGAQITATTNGKHVAGSDHYANRAIDFVPAGGMGSVTKADVRGIFERAGIPIRRNAGGVEQLFGPGDKDHDDHFHVAWDKGKASLDNYNASLKLEGEAAREAQQAQRELEQTLASITARLDPAAAAAAEYADAVAQIGKLQDKGAISPGTAFDLQMRAIAADKAQKAADFTQSFRSTFGEDVDDTINEWKQGLSAGAVAASEELTGGVRGAVNELRFAATGIADLLGIQIGGPFRQMLQNGGIERQASDVASAISKALRTAKVEFSETSEARLASIITGAGYGAVGGSIYSSISGRQGNGTLSAVGGILGNEGGKALASTITTAIGGKLGQSLGAAAGPLGAIAGGILGGMIGGLFKKSVKGAVSITGVDSSSYSGSSSFSAGLNKNASAVQQSLQQIADQLGATTGAFDVAIGKRDDWYHVGGSSSVNVMAAHPTGLIYEGKDEGEAIAAAVLNAVQDGAIQGLRAGTQRLLQLGGNIDAQLQKALRFEGVFTQLKQLKDPIGAAAEAIEKELASMRKVFDEAGATAEERAQMEELYALKRTDAIKQAQESAIGQLRDLLEDLKTGDNGLNLRSRQQNILSTLNPMIAAIEGGGKVDQEDFTAAARTYLDIQRELYGSTNAYFDSLKQVTDLTNKAIVNSGAGANITSLLSGLNQGAIAAAAAAGGSMPSGSVDVSGMVVAVNSQTGTLVDTLTSTSAATNARLDLISKQLAQQGSPMVLQLTGGGSGLAYPNALRNA